LGHFFELKVGFPSTGLGARVRLLRHLGITSRTITSLSAALYRRPEFIGNGAERPEFSP
jgi:hypothetical protein